MWHVDVDSLDHLLIPKLGPARWCWRRSEHLQGLAKKGLRIQVRRRCMGGGQLYSRGRWQMMMMYILRFVCAGVLYVIGLSVSDEFSNQVVDDRVLAYPF